MMKNKRPRQGLRNPTYKRILHENRGVMYRDWNLFSSCAAGLHGLNAFLLVRGIGPGEAADLPGSRQGNPIHEKLNLILLPGCSIPGVISLHRNKGKRYESLSSFLQQKYA